MKEKILETFQYLLFFFLFLISFLFLKIIAADETWSYGFAYNISTGLIPYRDFNMIIPPFFAHLFAIFLLFHKGIISFHMEQALMMAFICYLLKKLTKEKYIFLVLLLLILTPMIYNLPTYNTLCFALTLSLIYLEKKQKSNMIIGILLGLTLLTKQSIGLIILLVGLYLAKDDRKKLKERLLGLFFPLFMTFLYLFMTKSLGAFIDQCILGMFAFSKNGQAPLLQIIIILGVWAFACVYFRKKKYESFWLYILAFYSISIPLFDLTHFLMGAFAVLTAIIAHRENPLNPHIKRAIILLIILLPITNMVLTLKEDSNYPNDMKNYKYRYLNPTEYENLAKLREYHDEKKNQSIVILSSSAYIFKLTNGETITKLDLINQGNWGYNGTEKIIKEIKKQKNALFLINKEELTYDNQIDKEALKYVIANGKKVDKVLYFDVYRLN